MTLSKIKHISKFVREADVLLVLALIWFTGKFIRYVFPPLFELLQETFAVSTTSVGWAFSIFLFAYAAVQFPSGLLSDSYGSVWVITAGVLLSSLGAMLLVLDLPFGLFIIIMVILGVGTGIHKTSAVNLISIIYPRKKGRSLGLFDTFGTFGGVVAPAAVIIAATIPGSVPGWRILLFSTGLFGLILLFIFISQVSKEIANKKELIRKIKNIRLDDGFLPDNTQKSTAYVKIFREKRFVIFLLVSILFSFTYYGIVSFLPFYLTQEVGISSYHANLFYSVLFIASVSQILSGELSDQIGTVQIIVVALTFFTMSFVVFMLNTDSALLYIGVCVFCIGVGAHSFRPVRGSYLMELLPDDISAGGLGIVRTFLMSSGAVSPGIIGTISELAGFRIAFWLLAISIGAATICSMLLIYIEADIH